MKPAARQSEWFVRKAAFSPRILTPQANAA